VQPPLLIKNEDVAYTHKKALCSIKEWVHFRTDLGVQGMQLKDIECKSFLAVGT